MESTEEPKPVVSTPEQEEELNLEDAPSVPQEPLAPSSENDGEAALATSIPSETDLQNPLQASADQSSGRDESTAATTATAPEASSHELPSGGAELPHASAGDQQKASRKLSSRLFLGNLATEKLTSRDLREIFSKYGTLTEEPILRRSFGFIQFAEPEHAAAALIGEQGKTLGGLRLGMSPLWFNCPSFECAHLCARRYFCG